MQKNLYYRTVLRRQNVIKNFILDFFLAFASYPRLLLEVFIRKNFGERYFSLAAVVTLGFILLLFPSLTGRAVSYASGSLFGSGGYGYSDRVSSGSAFWSRYTTWYLFIAAFVYFSYLRWQEVKKNPSVFDFGRFSLCNGDINRFFYNLPVFNKRPNIRIIEILFEPGVFFLAGLILWLLGQALGTLLIFSSIFYSLSYLGAYKNGDNFVMDRIDEMILNEEMQSAFVDDLDTGKTRGVRFYAHKPNSEELRLKVTDAMLEEEEITEAR